MFPQISWSPFNGKERKIKIKKKNDDVVFNVDNVDF